MLHAVATAMRLARVMDCPSSVSDGLVRQWVTSELIVAVALGHSRFRATDVMWASMPVIASSCAAHTRTVASRDVTH